MFFKCAEGAYSHPFFIRDKPHLLVLLQRKTKKKIEEAPVTSLVADSSSRMIKAQIPSSVAEKTLDACPPRFPRVYMDPDSSEAPSPNLWNLGMIEAQIPAFSSTTEENIDACPRLPGVDATYTGVDPDSSEAPLPCYWHSSSSIISCKSSASPLPMHMGCSIYEKNS
jgi:hypothetical protein